MSDSPLGAFRILDASDSVAGQFAGRIFADYGAHVVLAEPRTGSAIRTAEPCVRDGSGAVSSLLFEHLNGGKESIVLDHTTPAGRAEFIDFCEGFDAVIIGDAALAAEVELASSRPIVAAITDFSDEGAYSDWVGSELVHQALSGSMFYTGLADRPPLYGVGHRASYAAGVQLYIALAAGLHQRLTVGVAPERVGVTVHEAAAAMEQNFSTQYSYNGTYPRRGEQTRPRGRAECRDGWVVFFVRVGQWAAFCDAFRAPELADDPRFADWGDLVRNWSEAAHELHLRAGDLSVADLAAAADRDRLVLAPIMTLDGLWDEPHLRGRDFWHSIESATGTTIPALGPLFRLSATTCRRDRPAPTLSFSSDPSTMATGLTKAPSATPEASRVAIIDATPRRPLEGIRVLDFSSAWAGPMATRLLASLGADVVKVEGPGRPDAWRGEPYNPPAPAPYPDLDPGERPYNRHAWFNSQNHDKRSVVLDVKQPLGLETIHQLVAASDVVLANWSPGALARAGLGYDRLTEINERVIVVEMPAISSSGPLANQRGLGPTMEGMSGITSLIGYKEGPPIGSGSAYLDPTGGVHGAAAVLTALLHRDLTGEGQHVEVAQREAAMHWIGELILDTVVNDTQHRANGNDSLSAAPHGAYPALGDDEWLAIAIETDEQWKAFTACFDSDALRESRFDTVGGRRAHRDVLDAEIGEVTRVNDKHILAATLQHAGVLAAPVQNGRDLFQDRHLRERGWFRAFDHPDVGVREYPGLPIMIDGERLQPRHPSPCFGQHTNEVLAELLDMNVHDITELANAHATAVAPRGKQ